MKRTKILPIALSVIIVILAAAVVLLLIFMKNQPIETRGVPALVEIAAMEPDSEAWGVNFANQYTTLLKTESNNTGTVYGGSDPVQKLEVDPRLVGLFAGYPFSKDYKEDRGHMNSVTDVEGTARINEKTPGTCYSCKSSSNPKLWAEMGMAAYDKTPFAELGARIEEPIGCSNCHEANSMRLIVTNPALEEALEAQGKDWTTFTRQEMRSVVCANCHVEYYFKGDGKYLTFPWAGGTTIEAIENYYNEYSFSDWTHPDSGTAMVKMQHPDYELFSAGSTHFNAGVACADCHMPYTRDGSVKFSTHDVHSPLIKPAQACGACHTDVEYVTGRVATIQKQVSDTMLATEDAILEAIDAIKTALAETGADAGLIAEARTLHRSAQLRWDFIAAENSMGFHNPEEALRILASATDLARQAQIKAVQALP
ncbi:MAG TPA: ammonia-forming cytochrome c nitrite reductase subunit c552 [Bellilinea sp.]|nr:ammonia-forming cytochrome c nitrite reductase subunit c552 [Bellilinea sp.]